MSNKKSSMLVLWLAIFFGVVGALVMWEHSDEKRYIQKIAPNSFLTGEVETQKLSAENESTAGNWTFIKPGLNFQGRFDISTIPEILDKFEIEHPIYP
ncbi:MAG: hypothetical protein UW04_C0029G0003 [Parcubacteria group bacterium GW2011_GWB1_43_8]|nr:MAG: hypothetical protein UW04_C0029G0003 [Parcubacteria group bacterium GW2011_GWB1_43_8]